MRINWPPLILIEKWGICFQLKYVKSVACFNCERLPYRTKVLQKTGIQKIFLILALAKLVIFILVVAINIIFGAERGPRVKITEMHERFYQVYLQF